MSEKTQNPYRGLSFFTILGLIFITLKLTGHITWSWWWVLAPLWVQFALVVIVLAIVGVSIHKQKAGQK